MLVICSPQSAKSYSGGVRHFRLAARKFSVTIATLGFVFGHCLQQQQQQQNSTTLGKVPGQDILLVAVDISGRLSKLPKLVIIVKRPANRYGHFKAKLPKTGRSNYTVQERWLKRIYPIREVLNVDYNFAVYLFVCALWTLGHTKPTSTNLLPAILFVCVFLLACLLACLCSRYASASKSNIYPSPIVHRPRWRVFGQGLCGGFLIAFSIQPSNSLVPIVHHVREEFRAIGKLDYLWTLAQRIMASWDARLYHTVALITTLCFTFTSCVPLPWLRRCIACARASVYVCVCARAMSCFMFCPHAQLPWLHHTGGKHNNSIFRQLRTTRSFVQ